MPPLQFLSTQYLLQTLSNQFYVDDYFRELDNPTLHNLLNVDIQAINTNRMGDQFFEEHAGFIQGYHQQGQSFLGYEAWLRLLDVIQTLSPNSYLNAHKGTAYYHAAIFALKADRFLEGLELMDYGYTEDQKNHGHRNAIGAPGGLYIGLRLAHGQGNDLGEAQRLDLSVRELIATTPRFNNRRFTLNFLKSRAKKYFLTTRGASRRGAWVALLACILEKKQIERFIRVTPTYREAQTSAKMTLSSLCLILETLLTYCPEANRNNTTMIDPLYQRLIDPRFPTIRAHRQEVYMALRTTRSNQLENTIDNYERLYGTETIAFALAWFLRNKVNHSFLASPLNVSLYNRLFNLLTYAIFVTMKVCYA